VEQQQQNCTYEANNKTTNRIVTYEASQPASQQDNQRTAYDVTLRRVRKTIVAMEKQ